MNGIGGLFDAYDASPAAEHEALIALSLVPGVGPGRLRALVAAFGSARVALGASRRALAAVQGIGPQTAGAIAAFDDHAEVSDQLRRAERLGAWLLTIDDPRFPELLRQIYDPPAFLWVRGTVVASDRTAVAVVGTRRPSSYGRRLAHDLARELAGRGITVVSGLAYGIDAAAHRGALDAGGRTIAVLGSGVDRVYPSRHEPLAAGVLGLGAVVSEYPLGCGPDAQNFPRRNRIISGLSLGTIVVEAYERGGALITAHLALQQNREVFAVPSPVGSPSGLGANRLIQRGGAKLVLSVEDVLDELDALLQVTEAPDPTAGRAPLSEMEQRIYDALSEEPRHIDDLCRETGSDISTALVHLLSLEFNGWVRQLAGMQFLRAG